MFINKHCLIFFIGIVFFTNCSQHNSDRSTQPIDKQIALSVGNVKITAYEFEKNLNFFKNQFSQQGAHLDQHQAINSWKNDFINRTYILADAYSKGYDKDKHIDSIVESAAHLMIAQPEGLLDKKMNETDTVTADDVKKAINRSKKQIHIEYFKFSDTNNVVQNIKGAIPNNATDFNRLKEKINFLDVPYKRDSLIWPFNGYWGKEEEIYNLKNNAVSPLLRLSDGYYLIHAERIDYVNQPAPTTTQMKVKLQFLNRQKLKELLNNDVFIKAQPIIKNDVVLMFASNLNNYVYGPGHTFRKNDFTKLLTKIMLVYVSPLGQTKEVTTNDFIDFYNLLFIKTGVKNAEDINRFLFDMIFSDYAYVKAVKMGIVNEPKFLLDKRNFKNNTIFNTYLENELADKSPITNAEIKTEYELIKSRFKQPLSITASVYYFNSKQEALKKYFNLKNDTIKFTGLIKANKHMIITYKSKTLPDTLKTEIFNINNKNRPAKMVEYKGQYIVAQKEDEMGSRIRDLSEVRGLVITEIRRQRLVENQRNRLIQLKNKYAMQVNLTNDLNAAQTIN